MRRPQRVLMGMILLLPACTPPPPPPPGTGAAEVAQQFFQAVLAQDAKAARELLEPESQAKRTPEQLQALFRAYRRNLGFEPAEARLRFCEERGDEASAHVMIHGHSAGKARHAKEAVLLRKTTAGWGVVLPDNFGRKSNAVKL